MEAKDCIRRLRKKQHHLKDSGCLPCDLRNTDWYRPSPRKEAQSPFIKMVVARQIPWRLCTGSNCVWVLASPCTSSVTLDKFGNLSVPSCQRQWTVLHRLPGGRSLYKHGPKIQHEILRGHEKRGINHLSRGKTLLLWVWCLLSWLCSVNWYLESTGVENDHQRVKKQGGERWKYHWSSHWRVFLMIQTLTAFTYLFMSNWRLLPSLLYAVTARGCLKFTETSLLSFMSCLQPSTHFNISH